MKSTGVDHGTLLDPGGHPTDARPTVPGGPPMFMTLILSALLTSASAAQPDEAPQVPAGTEVIEHSTRDYAFSYSYPPEAAAVPAIEALLRRDARSAEATTRGYALEGRRERDSHFLTHEFSQEWRTDANLNELIVLSGAAYSFTGGAHGNTQFVTFLWDRSAGRRIQFRDLFSDSNAALALLQSQYCPLLKAERVARLEGEEEEARTDCPEASEYPVTVVTGASGLIESFRVLLPPYAAGSYVEGTYEIDVPLTDALMRLIRARYAAAFVLPSGGSGIGVNQ